MCVVRYEEGVLAFAEGLKINTVERENAGVVVAVCAERKRERENREQVVI